MSPAPHAVIAIAFACALPACDSCHATKPYTPYTLGDSASAGRDAGAPPAIAGDGGAYPVLEASPAPLDGKSWALASGVVEPPAGHAFSLGLVADVDGDGTDDLVALARSPDGARGELWFASGKAPSAGRVLAALPGELGAPGCKAKPSLARIGPGMIAFDDEARCDKPAKDRMGRWVAIFRALPGAPPELGLELRFAHTADGESLKVALDGRDRDGDGRGDLTATLTLEGAPRPLPPGGSASATLAFFDRPAGLSRDPSEPEASWKALASGLVADGRRKTTASRVGPTARAAKRLRALLCEEEGKPGVTMTSGAIRCGDPKFGEEMAVSEVEAAINLGDPFGAVAALARIESKRKDVDSLVAKNIPSIAGKLAHTTSAEPDLATGPATSPVAILSTGDLLLKTRDKIVKVDHASFQESAVEAAIEWPSRVGPRAAGGWKLTAIDDRCEGPTMTAELQGAGEPVILPLPLVSSRCGDADTARKRPLDGGAFDVLGTTPQGALVAIRGELVTLPLEATPSPALAESLALAPNANQELGAARSPNGQVVAVSSPRGVLVATLKGTGRGATAKLWTGPVADGASACVPSDAADRLACVVKRKVAIYDAK